MGTYINVGNTGFQRARNSEYVDKSALISVVNRTLFTERQFSCVTRCRRFGKSTAARMLYAYYDHSCDSRSLFADLEIAGDPTFEQHLNKYAAIYLDITNFVSKGKDDDIVNKIDAALIEDVSKAYADVPVKQDDCLMDYLLRISIATGEQFVFIIDEWDAICREFAPAPRRWMLTSAGCVACSRAKMPSGCFPFGRICRPNKQQQVRRGATPRRATKEKRKNAKFCLWIQER